MNDIDTKIILLKNILPELLNLKCSKYHIEQKNRWYFSIKKGFKKYTWYLIHYKNNSIWKYRYISRERLNCVAHKPRPRVRD